MLDLSAIQTALTIAPTVFFAAFAIFGLFLLSRATLVVFEITSSVATAICAALILVAVGIVGIWIVL